MAAQVPLPERPVWRISTCNTCRVSVSGFEPTVEKYARCDSCTRPWSKVERFDAGRLCGEAYDMLRCSRIEDDE